MSHTRSIAFSPSVPPMRPRLVLHADCTNCGRLNRDKDDPSGVSELALRHTHETGHVVVLNGTTDVPDAEEGESGDSFSGMFRLPSIEHVLDDRAASFWVKSALRTLLSRDPVDAANDAELVAKLLERRCREILTSDPPPQENPI
jgi:hypothetical protein